MDTRPELITVSGRVLPTPQICYKNIRHGDERITPQGGTWNMRQIRFSRFTQLRSWCCLYINHRNVRTPWRDHNDLMNTLKRFVGKLNDMGIAAGAPVVCNKIDLNGNNDEEAIDRAIDKLMDNRPQLIFTILFDADSTAYNAVKKVCDVRRGVLNVNVVASKLAGGNEQYFANVALKFNLKLGGLNQSLKPNDLGIIAEGKTMIVGIDVTHPSPGSSSSAPSVAGIVASIDPSLGQWPGDIRVQGSREEMVSGLDDLVKGRIHTWARNNRGMFPENIIVYRDGVSEGQYELVIDNELQLMKKACRSIYSATDSQRGFPRMTVIIVGKGHHTRFYPTSERDADKSNNTRNGTVVDRGVTQARNWDFFLQAHAALKGTARPAHYYIVWDEIFHYQKPKPPFRNAADVLESLTHNICYLFGRATKPVSVCPPAYYADLVCERARCYLSSVFDPTPEATPSGSLASGAAGGKVAENSDVRIHENVKDSMFYI